MAADAPWLTIAILIGIAYLLGSLPTAWIVGRLHGIDIFRVGSGNMGGTNIARALGLPWGVATMLLDMGKGIVAILIARQLWPTMANEATVLAALACIVGHNWSLCVAALTGRLRGGKGAAVVCGTLLVIVLPVFPQIFLVASALGIAILILTRYVSLSALVTIGCALLWILLLVSEQRMHVAFNWYAVLSAALILYRFRENIQRLLAGNERRLGEFIQKGSSA